MQCTLSTPGWRCGLLNAPRQAVEALTLGLAAMELEATGVLRRSLVIPLDLHQDLFREELELGSRTSTLSAAPTLRSCAHSQRTVFSMSTWSRSRHAGSAGLAAHDVSGGDRRSAAELARGLAFHALRHRASGTSRYCVLAWCARDDSCDCLTRYVDRAQRYGYLPSAGDAAYSNS